MRKEREKKQYVLKVRVKDHGSRLDRWLSDQISHRSRSQIQKGIRAGRVSVDGVRAYTPAQRLHGGELVVWEPEQSRLLTPAAVEISILFEDDQIIVVDKPAGMVVHPGAGENKTTLVEGLLFTRSLPVGDDPTRPGIPHRLDKETTGAIIVAKTEPALKSLQEQFAARKVRKAYIAQVEGKLSESEGLIDAPIGRDPSRPRRMAVQAHGRPAQTEFRVLCRGKKDTLLLVLPQSGRTHQIRVHMCYIGHPIVGDSIYGTTGEGLRLHAWQIEVTHPETGERMVFEAPIPPGFPDYPYREIAWPAPPPTDSRVQPGN
ncbi:MAG: RluA family pseudouridine synthase [Candidatus Bipolaricaulota bacterium]|nr:RluA family pseudouridine synthase [Candidatus Bipolaricaulota bacterium]